MADAPRYLVRAREIQEGVMHDACRIDRETTDFDRETGKDITVWTEVWAGPCRMPRADAAGRVIVTGETITPTGPTVKIPWHVTGIRADDRVTCTDSVTPQNIGRVLWVDSDNPRTYQSAVTLTCREVP